MVRFLIVDADDCHAGSLVGLLRRRGYASARVHTGRAALANCRNVGFVLCALALPDIDGVEFCRAFRRVSDAPIVVFTDRDDELDRVLSLQAGADDCVSRCLVEDELLARIEAVQRRVHPQATGDRVIIHGRLCVDPVTREVRVAGRGVATTRKEFDLLCLLARHAGQTVSRRRLMAQVWNDTSEGAADNRTIDTHVSALRAKLGAREWIVSVRGVGFRLGSG